ncbi:MAG: glycoside hydrolase family 99-like domain-containing protein [Lachnospiraceae bacterium]|nr:glycoside hydrolase family 99-like domain-containing protein [Lachnospiraceae bacterium]
MKARVIAYYLPQYHPIPENDKFWGKGFTEWTNVAKAKPLFWGHQQPNIPADLGFYDLRLPQVREEQAKLAKEAGIEGFCYWHYWFGNGKKVLNMPFDEVLKSGEPDLPFCLGWANHSWTTKTWEKGKSFSQDMTIFEQLYPGTDDYVEHFYDVLPAFKDDRYITVEGKPLFVVFDPDAFKDVENFIKTWNSLAVENGLRGIYFVGRCDALPEMSFSKYKKMDEFAKKRYQEVLGKGFDGINSVTLKYAEFKATGLFHKAFHSALRKMFGGIILDKYKYKDIIDNFVMSEDYMEKIYPQLIPRRDRSPRAGRKAMIYYGSTPQLFGQAAERAVKCVEEREFDKRLIFLNAWNEWGEGAYMEPDLKYGHGYIDALRKVLDTEVNLGEISSE